MGDHVTGITYDDFSKLDLKVARIVAAEPIPGKTKIIHGMVDVGDEIRSVIIGGAQYYKPEDLLDKTVIVVANLEPKTLAGIQSDAMLLAADVDGKPFWLTVNGDVPLGSPIK